MQLPDLINGLFEFCGGLMIWINVRQIWKDRMVKGVHWIPTMFFTSWGVWNLYYYPHLGQWLSFCGGLSIVTGNLTWVSSMLYFWRKHE